MRAWREDWMKKAREAESTGYRSLLVQYARDVNHRLVHYLRAVKP